MSSVHSTIDEKNKQLMHFITF